MFKFVKRLVLFFGLLLLFLELFFRFVIPAAELPYGAQLQEPRVMALDQSADETGKNTIGRFGRPAYRWRVNNDGYNSAIDYRPAGERELPCAVVLGNSYVQGMYSDVENHLAGRLHAGLDGAMEVYNLGVAGMPFSQAPLMARLAAERYEPELILILTGASSIDNSLRTTTRVPYCRQFSFVDGEMKVHPPSRFVANRRNRLLRKSALVRYLFYNAQYNLGGRGFEQADVQPQGADAEPDELDADSPLWIATRTSMEEIRTLAPNAKILIVRDADRRTMYESNTKPAPLAHGELVRRLGDEFGFEYLDLTDAFWNEYRSEKRKFNFEKNYHWNPYGVSVAASAILEKLEDMGVSSDMGPQLTEKSGGR